MDKENVEELKFNVMKIKVLKKLRIDSLIDIFKFIIVLMEMDGIYIWEYCGWINFLNDIMYEIIVYYFGREVLEVIL